MDSCVEAANEVFEYSVNAISHQYSFEDRVNLSPLGLGFTEWKPIDTTGLRTPPSLITQEIIDARNNLTLMYNES